MNQERLAELRRDLDAEAYTSYLPKTVRELLDHIDGLKFANGVLDSAAKDAQTWSYEAQTAKEAYCELLEANRVMEAEGGAIAQLNRMIDELRAQLEAQRGGAVVVPDLSSGCVIRWWNEMADKNRHCHWDSLDDSEKISATREYIAKHMAAVPASQVLQPGMVGVDRKGLQDVYEALAYSQPSEPSIDPHSNSMAHRRALGFCADALRSQAGGEG